MMPQSFCSIPTCGKAFGAPNHSRGFIVAGRLQRLTYPSLISMHDVIPRSQGGDPLDIDNNVPLCVDCHHRHHSIEKFDFKALGEGRYAVRVNGEYVPLRIADECESA